MTYQCDPDTAARVERVLALHRRVSCQQDDCCDGQDQMCACDWHDWPCETFRILTEHSGPQGLAHFLADQPEQRAEPDEDMGT